MGIFLLKYDYYMEDKKLEQQFNEFAKLGNENKNIDVAGLMLNALNKGGGMVSEREKKRAYFVSVLLPPFGLLYALKFYIFSKEEDASTVGHGCVILTILSVGALWVFFKLFLSSSGTSMDQLQQINPKTIQNTLGS